jgi:hypothetical protein
MVNQSIKKFLKLRTLDRIWLLAPLVLCFVLLNFSPLKEGDLWWHIKVGEDIAQLRRIPQVDQFSFTASGLPFYFTRSWLSGFILYVAYQLGSLSTLVLLQAVIGTITVGVILMTCWNKGATIRSASIATMLSFIGLFPFSTARPVIFSYLCFALIVWILYLHRFKEISRLWLLPIIMVLWVNLNSAWITGIFILGVYTGLSLIETIMGRRTWKEDRFLLLWGLLSILVIIINPIGFGIFDDIFTATSNPVNKMFISEWQPVVISNWLSFPFFLTLGLFILSLAFSKTRSDWIEIVLVLCLAALALRYLRILPFFYILIAPTLAYLWVGISIKGASGGPQKKVETNRSSSRVGLLMGIGILMVTLISIPHIRYLLLNDSEQNSIDPDFPIGASDFISQIGEDGNRLFSQPEWGGYFIFRHHPKIEVFIDGRVEQFPIPVWDDYFHIINARPGWLELIEDYQIDYLILNKKKNINLISAVLEKELNCPYEDNISMVCIINDE